MDIQLFSVAVAQQQIDDLKLRLSLARYPEHETVSDWSQGVPLDYLRTLADYWQNSYDMQRLQTRLNALPQFIADIDGLDIHFIHVRSPEPNARPLILSHGWPGSVVEFLKVIPLLTDPAAHGGDAADAFHVVCPSLPGFGFSGKPTASGWGVPRIAGAFAQLMAALGYSAYFAQGGDWGSAVTTNLAQQDPHCRAIHLNMVPARPTAEQAANPTDAEKVAFAALQYYRDWDSGYSTQQGTRPQTIGYSLVDSPTGLLAWIVETYWAWTDSDGNPENVLSKD
ncbi:MAG: epoxide hydrolase, partial [Spongiibacteraceae bacterium]